MRLFVAVTPPPHVLDAVADLSRPARSGVRWTTRDQWHVTLRFLGEVPDPEPVATALGAVTWPAARATIGPAVAVLGRHVLMLPVDGVDPVADLARRATAPHAAADERPFRGHLTLARVKRGSAAGLAGERFAAGFALDAVSLIRSHLHREGARYEALATFPVQGP